MMNLGADPHRTFRAIAMLALGAMMLHTASAQVTIRHSGDEIVIENAGFAAQRAVRTAGKNGGDWRVEDGRGNSYQACRSTCAQNANGTWTCDSFSSADKVDPELVSGYQAALQYLVENYGAVVEHDDAMDLDYVSFPDADDPYELLARVLTTEYLNGRLLVNYFKNIELSTIGINGDEYAPVKPKGRALTFPDDPFYASQWNLDAANLAKAHWHPFESRLGRPVRVGVIDSGISEEDQNHSGLDGVAAIHHRWIGLTTGFAVPHGLAVTSLLADRGHDGNGGAGLAASWGSCGASSSVFNRHPIEIYSYNVGDWGPVSYLVAGAIDAAIEDGVDIININFRAAYSPLIEKAVREALAEGIIVVAAAGNYHASHPTKPTGFPASIEGVISVGSSNKGGALSRFSASEGFTILAPGEDILVGAPNDAWAYGAGTSFASPHVVAAAALLKMANPFITPGEVTAALTAAKSKGGGLDALAALNGVLPKSERVSNAFVPSGCSSTQKNGATALVQEISATLHGNYPNPFNPSTSIVFSVPETDELTLSVFDVSGKLVHNEIRQVEPGMARFDFSGAELVSGSYYYRVDGAGYTLRGHMILLK